MGTVFRVTTGGILTSLASFTGANGANPYAGLCLGTDGALYGTTINGGIRNGGVFYRITMDGTLTPIFFLDFASEVRPEYSLTLGADGAFYGTACFPRTVTDGSQPPLPSPSGPGGGTTGGEPGDIPPNIPPTVPPDTEKPPTMPPGGLGPTTRSDLGKIFRITTNGTFTPLLSFTGANGADPHAGLTLGSDGAFYGTASAGGSGGAGSVFRLSAWSFFSSPIIANGDYVVKMTGQPGVTYTLESANAVTGPWQKRTNITAPTSDFGYGIGVVEFSEPVGTASRRFYRTAFPAY